MRYHFVLRQPFYHKSKDMSEYLSPSVKPYDLQSCGSSLDIGVPFRLLDPDFQGPIVESMAIEDIF